MTVRNILTSPKMTIDLERYNWELAALKFVVHDKGFLLSIPSGYQEQLCLNLS